MEVSMATLNSALKELEAQRVITRKHGVGIFVSPQLHQKTIVILCDAALLRSAGHSPFWDILFDTARERASSHNELLETHLVPRDALAPLPLQRGLTSEIESRQIYGIIGIGLGNDVVRWIEAQNVPFVSLFGSHYAPHSVSVGIDTQAMIHMGVKALRERGCKRVGIWKAAATYLSQSPSALPEDFLSLQSLLEAYGLPNVGMVQLNEHLAGKRERSTPSHESQGYETAIRVFGDSRSTWPDGLMITDDMMARGVFPALQKLNVQVGRDVHIVTHANRGSDFPPQAQGAFALVEFDPSEIVETVFAQLESLMIGQTPSQAEFNLLPNLRFVAAGVDPSIQNSNSS
jgi:DNA-binding LacI/PurR family transcriptional regulator